MAPVDEGAPSRPGKILGVGLNKTGTKTLRSYFREWGLRHRTYDLDAFHRWRRGEIEALLDEMEDFDSFEDWPWPLMYREIDERFPDARFVLTVRRDADTWYRSLCKMAVRIGPMRDFEPHIYGYAMPHGHRDEHVAIYHAHNEAVEAHFRDRPGKLLRICWEEGDDGRRLADFLGLPHPETATLHTNRSAPVYDGDNLALAHLNRVVFQTRTRLRDAARGLLHGIRHGRESTES